MSLFRKSKDINEELIQFQNTKNAILLDVRSKEEYEMSHIPESINIGLTDIEKVNEIQRLYLSSEEIASKYLANLVSDILYNPKDIYDKLDKETRDKYSTYSEFEHLTVRIKTIKFLSAEVISYSSGVVDGKRAVYVIDKDDNKFVFIENSINNYKIRIN